MKKVKKGVLAVFLVSMGLSSHKVGVLSYEQLETSTQKSNDTLYIVNFWATWCRPCVGELPYFLESARKNTNQKVKFLFASINSLKEMEIVQKFTDTRNITQQVFILNAGNPNVWLDKIDKSWGGSIPATVMYRNNKKVFFKEGEFTQTEIDSVINLKLK